LNKLIAAVAAGLLACTLLVPAVHAQSRADTLGRIRAAKAINVAYSRDSLPFSFESNGKPVGYSIDLCNRVIAGVGRAVGEPDLKVNWMPGTVSERLAMVSSGKADLDCANTSATLGRMGNVDFSSLVFIDSGGFMVRADAKLARFADLNGRKIAVIAGTTTQKHVEGALRKHLVNATVIPVKAGDEGLAMLESGAVDALASDKVKLVGLAVQAKNPASLSFLSEDLSYEPYAFALPRNDSAFRLEVNRALSQVYAQGGIEPIFAQWLGKLGRPTGLLAAMYVLHSIPE
jgi:polar amino acid transport system substrate-binding protein/glutamate/aspartate transport system substrate-binding protein